MIINCWKCWSIVTNPKSTSHKCANCKSKSISFVFDEKWYLWDGNYYWLESIRKLLWDNYEDIIDNVWVEWVIFKKNKNRWSWPSRLWWMKRWAMKSIETNMWPWVVDWIAKWLPIDFEEAYSVVNFYMWELDKCEYKYSSKKWDFKDAYIGDDELTKIKQMCRKYIAVHKLELSIDDDEEFVLFTFENPIEYDILLKIMSAKRLYRDKYQRLLDIMKNLP